MFLLWKKCSLVKQYDTLPFLSLQMQFGNAVGLHGNKDHYSQVFGPSVVLFIQELIAEVN